MTEQDVDDVVDAIKGVLSRKPSYVTARSFAKETA
jgi:hypothetical protein